MMRPSANIDDGSRRSDTIQPRLRIDDLHVSYGRGDIVRGISLSVLPREVVLITGENGSGKSSFLRAVAGQIVPTQGTIEIDGQRIEGLAPHQVHGHGVCSVLQGGRVFGSMTVEENILVARSRRLNGHTVTWQELFPVLARLGRRRAALLSGGERQMLAIAMALVQGPRLLLLDEPTSGLSGELVARCLESVSQHARDFDASVVLVEQNVEASVLVADRALVLSEGGLIPYSSGTICPREGNTS